ncbi:MAG: DUF1207 domain-containing protein, partial [Chlamydiia bacterium]|nr:DUF1207 domain-containing protein [Chlamydiia bacterium]
VPSDKQAKPVFSPTDALSASELQKDEPVGQASFPQDSQQAFLGLFWPLEDEPEEECATTAACDAPEQDVEEDSCDVCGDDCGPRTWNVPAGRLEKAPGPYLAGYIQSLVDTHFYAHGVRVASEGDKVVLSNLPSSAYVADKIRRFVLALPCVKSVEIRCESTEEPAGRDCCCCDLWGQHKGVWFPGSPSFRPFIADPREPRFTVARRWDDEALSDHVLQVAMGGTIPVLRIFGSDPYRGDVELDLSGGVLAYWDVDYPGVTALLMAHDYYVAVPLTYQSGDWALRARYRFESSYIGDELLQRSLQPPGAPFSINHHTAELHLAWQPTGALRYYIGAGHTWDSDPFFELYPWFAEAGGEVYLWPCSWDAMGMSGVPFLAMHLKWAEAFGWNYEGTYALGLEWGASGSLSRSLRTFIEFHEGLETAGQFSKTKASHLAIKATYGF